MYVIPYQTPPKEALASNRLTQSGDFKNTFDSMIDAFFTRSIGG
jgi:hypothetical protein